MRGIISLLFMLILSGLAPPAWAVEESKTLFLQEATTATTGDGTPMPVHPYTSVAVQVTISATGTVIFEGSIDGTTYAAKLCTLSTDASTASSVDATGTYQCNVSGMALFRARITANTGTITVFARASTAMFSGGGGGTTGWPTASTTKEITWANSLANAARFGDGVTPICLYTDATLGPQVRPCTDANVSTIIPTNFTWSLYDIEGALAMETVDPDAASTLLMWSYPNAAYRPLKTVYFDAGAITPDGTNCTAPTEQALNGSEKTWAFSCADSNSSIFSGKIRMRTAWDAGTLLFTLSLFHGTTETITFAGDFSAMCRRAGSTDVINSTYGTGVAADVSITTANEIEEATTAAVTANGTCAAGSWLLWRYVVDAANFSANAANAKVLGVTMQYREVSRGD